jgi:hypothetical protein
MDPQEVREEMGQCALKLRNIADAYVQIRKGHLFVDLERRAEAKALLHRFQQGYPSNKKLQGFKIGTRFTWTRLRDLADTIYVEL